MSPPATTRTGDDILYNEVFPLLTEYLFLEDMLRHPVKFKEEQVNDFIDKRTEHLKKRLCYFIDQTAETLKGIVLKEYL